MRRAAALTFALAGPACASQPANNPREAPPPLAATPADAAAHDDPIYARLLTLLELPRALGHPQREVSIDALASALQDGGAHEVERQTLTAIDPATGIAYPLTNIIAHLHPDAPRRLVLATHFDTRPWADEDPDPRAHTKPVPGANDGTSGVAILLELLPELARQLPPSFGVTVILFDGEELGHSGDTDGYCVGSRYFADRAKEAAPPWLARTRLGIVLDMVGDRDLHLPIEPTSFARAPKLVRLIWDTAADRGHDAFEDRLAPFGVLDDHTFLTHAGIRSVLLIDKDYPPWHTRQDTADKVSAASLRAVSDVVRHAVLALQDPERYDAIANTSASD